MTTLEISPTENKEPKPVIKKVSEWKRATFDFYDGKAWCYKKMVQLDHREKGDLWPMDYYCYNCKGELFFKPHDHYKRDNPPFRFHKLLVKVLEKKEDDWKTLRKTHTYYAFCCKCAKKDESDGSIKKRWGKLMNFEVDNCDCEAFIEKKQKEAVQAIENYNSIFADCEYLINKIEDIVVSEVKDRYDFKTERIKDFIKQLQTRQDDAITNEMKEKKYLETYHEWETKLKNSS